MKKQLVLFLALALCLGLTACGDTESDDTQSGYETVMDMEFLDGMWSIDGTAKLYFDSTEGFYAYRTRWGLGGRGEFELSEASGRPMIFFNGLLYNFLLRDDGVLLPNRNGEGSGFAIHRHTFLRDYEAEIVEWDISAALENVQMSPTPHLLDAEDTNIPLPRHTHCSGSGYVRGTYRGLTTELCTV